MFELLKTTGKELFACQSAVRDFSGILKTVGGEKEQERARYVVLGSVYMYHVHCEFMKKITCSAIVILSQCTYTLYCAHLNFRFLF